MEKKRIIFDLDGTLIDFNDYHRSVINLFNHLNISYTNQDIETYIKSMIDYEVYFDRYELDTYREYLSEINGINLKPSDIEYYFSDIDLLIPYQEIDETTKNTLEYLRNKYDLVLLTNYFKDVQTRRMDRMHMLDYFSEVYGADTIKKPHPEAFLNACGSFPKEECIMIGDNRNLDYGGALSAGLDAILINPHRRKKGIKRLIKKL